MQRLTRFQDRLRLFLLFAMTFVTTAAKAGDESVTPSTAEPESGLMVFISSSGDLDKDISTTTVPLANAAAKAATSKNVGRASRDITVGIGYRLLLKYVGGADKDDVLLQEGVILCRLWTSSDGKTAMPSPVEKFRILPGRDPKTGKKLTPEDVEAAALSYLDKTAEPPPGTLAYVKAHGNPTPPGLVSNQK